MADLQNVLIFGLAFYVFFCSGQAYERIRSSPAPELPPQVMSVSISLLGKTWHVEMAIDRKVLEAMANAIGKTMTDKPAPEAN